MKKKDREGYISSSDESIDLTTYQVVQNHFTISRNEGKHVDNQTSASMPEIVKPLAVTKDELTVSGLQASSKLDPPKLVKVVPPKESTSLSHPLSPDSRAAYMIARMQSDQQKTDISAQTQVLPKIAEQNEVAYVPVKNV